jgi:chromosome segregation ATPase
MLVACDTDHAAVIASLTRENAELKRQLASAQDLLVESAIEVGDLRAGIDALRTELTEAQATRDAWRDEAERLVGWGARTA